MQIIHNNQWDSFIMTRYKCPHVHTQVGRHTHTCTDARTHRAPTHSTHTLMHPQRDTYSFYQRPLLFWAVYLMTITITLLLLNRFCLLACWLASHLFIFVFVRKLHERIFVNKVNIHVFFLCYNKLMVCKRQD